MANKKPAQKKPSLGQLVDELGAIEKELAPLKARIKRAELLRKSIREQAPESTNQIEGEKFVAMLGEHARRTIVDYIKLVKRIGAVAFSKFATATLDQLEKNVPAIDLAHCLTTEETGPRSLQVVEKGAVAA